MRELTVIKSKYSFMCSDLLFVFVAVYGVAVPCFTAIFCLCDKFATGE